MKLVRANYISHIERDSGNVILVNNLNRSIIELQNVDFRNFKENKIENLGSKLVDQLVEKSFLYKSKEDEYVTFTDWYYMSQENEEFLNITILTTTNCNLKCSYCYEKSVFENSGNISDIDIDNIITFIRKNLEKTKLKNVQMTFYGGEPLLNEKAIFSTIEKIKNNSLLNDIDITYSIFTNGTLINSNHIKLFNDNFRSLVVSLDIPTGESSEKRLFKDGSSSFNKTFNNIKNLDRLYRGEISLSLVVDINNYDKIEYLYELLKNNNLTHIFLHISLANPTFNGNCFHSTCHSSNLEENIHIINYCHSLAYSYNIMTNFMKFQTSGLCMLRRKSHILVTPNGNIKKCIGLIGDETFSLGKIKSATQNFYKYQEKLDELIGSTNTWINKFCKACSILPLCFGGCRYLNMIENKDIKAPYCHKTFFLESELLLTKNNVSTLYQ